MITLLEADKARIRAEEIFCRKSFIRWISAIEKPMIGSSPTSRTAQFGISKNGKI